MACINRRVIFGSATLLCARAHAELMGLATLTKAGNSHRFGKQLDRKEQAVGTVAVAIYCKPSARWRSADMGVGAHILTGCFVSVLAYTNSHCNLGCLSTCKMLARLTWSVPGWGGGDLGSISPSPSSLHSLSDTKLHKIKHIWWLNGQHKVGEIYPLLWTLKNGRTMKPLK